MTVGILWKDSNAYLLVSGGGGEYEVVNGMWTLYLNEESLEGYCIAPRNTRINLRFDKFTYLTDTIKYQTLCDYNEILNDARELGEDKHKDVDTTLENQKYKECIEKYQTELDKEYKIPF